MRGDGHYGTPEVMELLEDQGCDYIFGLSNNARLSKIGHRLFPWSEVEAVAADPGASLRDVVARIVAGTEETRDGEPRPP